MDLFNKLKENPQNPRSISQIDFKRLKASIKRFPKMLELRPIVYDENFIVLGGNMRLLALRDLVKEGFVIKKEYFKSAKDFSEEEKREFVIKDNISQGEWDYEKLANEWSDLDLAGWGLSVPSLDNFYTKQIKAPIYEVKNKDVSVKDLINIEKGTKLVEEIEKSTVSSEEKEFLLAAATRHLVFDYSLIAEYYAKAGKEMQGLMEKSALVIIDYDKALENGYIKLMKNLMDIQGEDYEE